MNTEKQTVIISIEFEKKKSLDLSNINFLESEFIELLKNALVEDRLIIRNTEMSDEKNIKFESVLLNKYKK